jgi:hypothetical protein
MHLEYLKVKLQIFLFLILLLLNENDTYGNVWGGGMGKRENKLKDYDE